MKAIAINGSPRKGWNTDMLLKQALKGASDAGAETELIQLSELTFSGCRSCFACKRAGAETGRCMWKDDLQQEALMRRISVKCGKNSFPKICKPLMTLVSD